MNTSRKSKSLLYRRLASLPGTQRTTVSRGVGAGSFGEEAGVNFIYCCLLPP
jgi:hypothetical protein